MDWSKLPLALLRSPVFRVASDASMGTWVRLVAWCMETESPGRLAGAGLWPRRHWPALVGSSRGRIDRVIREGLANWDGDDLVVEGFDTVGLEALRSQRSGDGPGVFRGIPAGQAGARGYTMTPAALAARQRTLANVNARRQPAATAPAEMANPSAGDATGETPEATGEAPAADAALPISDGLPKSPPNSAPDFGEISAADFGRAPNSEIPRAEKNSEGREGEFEISGATAPKCPPKSPPNSVPDFGAEMVSPKPPPDHSAAAVSRAPELAKPARDPPEPWIRILRAVGAKVFASNEEDWRRICGRWPPDQVAAAASTLPATVRWPDRVEESLAADPGKHAFLAAVRAKIIEVRV